MKLKWRDIIFILTFIVVISTLFTTLYFRNIDECKELEYYKGQLEATIIIIEQEKEDCDVAIKSLEDGASCGLFIRGGRLLDNLVNSKTFQARMPIDEKERLFKLHRNLIGRDNALLEEMGVEGIREQRDIMISILSILEAEIKRIVSKED